MNKNLLTYAILGAGAYYFFMRKKRTGRVIVPEVETISKEQFDQTDATVNADKAGLSLPEALETAKNIADQLKDAKINIFKGGKKLTIRKGIKKVKLTADNKAFFKKLRMKGGQKLSTKQKKSVKFATTNLLTLFRK
jgi:hypothetical protein